MIWGLAVIGFIVQLLFIKVEKKGDMKKALLFKMIAASFFVAVGVIGVDKCPDRHFGMLVLLGLVFGWFGDFFLNYQFISKKQDLVFVIGAVAFLTNHIFYIAALVPFAEGTFVKAIVVTGVALVTVTHWIVKQADANVGLKIFGHVYLSTLTFITAETFVMFLSDTKNIGILIMCIGAALFTVSDYILILNSFSSKKKAWMRTANLVAYYLGQVIIAGSMVYYIA